MDEEVAGGPLIDDAGHQEPLVREAIKGSEEGFPLAGQTVQESLVEGQLSDLRHGDRYGQRRGLKSPGCWYMRTQWWYMLSSLPQILRSSREDSESIMLASSTREDEKPGLESEAGAATGLALPPQPNSLILTGGLRMTWWGAE